MSTAVTFLLVALAFAVVGSAVLWMLQNRPSRRPAEYDFQAQLRAIAPNPRREPVAGPDGTEPQSADSVVDEER